MKVRSYLGAKRLNFFLFHTELCFGLNFLYTIVCNTLNPRSSFEWKHTQINGKIFWLIVRQKSKLYILNDLWHNLPNSLFSYHNKQVNTKSYLAAWCWLEKRSGYAYFEMIRRLTSSLQFNVYILRKHMLRSSKIVYCTAFGNNNKAEREWDKFLTSPKDVNPRKQWIH